MSHLTAARFEEPQKSMRCRSRLFLDSNHPLQRHRAERQILQGLFEGGTRRVSTGPIVIEVVAALPRSGTVRRAVGTRLEAPQPPQSSS